MRTQAVKFRLLGRVGLSAKDSTPYWPPTVEQSTGYPGYDSIIGPENATVAEIPLAIRPTSNIAQAAAECGH
jgi:hypothetical protein